MSRILYTLVLTVLFCHNSFAQPGEVEVTERDGKKFYVHIVQQGNTLWGLYSTYKVPVDEIIKSNPGVEDGLAIGQIVYVPLQDVASQESKNSVQKEVKHIVEQGETLYGISKKYNVSIDQLLALNPQATEGLSIGQEILIQRGEKSVDIPVMQEKVAHSKPSTKVVFKDSLVEHTVLKHETLYSISKRFMVPVDSLTRLNGITNNKIKAGDLLLIPLKKESVRDVKIRDVPAVERSTVIDTSLIFLPKEQFKIAVLLPMNYDLNAGVYGLTPEAQLNRYTYVATEFYMGIKLALDSLAKMGLKADVSLFDTKADSLTTTKILSSMENTDWDLIIGPLMPAPSKVAATWAKQHKVPILAPVPVPMANLKGNKYVFASVPSDNRLLEGMADQLVMQHAKHNIILVKSGLKADEKNYEIVRKRVNDQLGSGAYRGTLKEVNLGATSGRDIASHIQKDMVNIFVVPSESRVFAANFMTTMNKVRNISKTYDEADIRVYGLREWDSYQEIKLNYKRRLNLHYPTAVSLNYEEQKVQDFIRIFRSVYKTDPDKYAIQGFDVTLHFIAHYLMKSNQTIEGVINDIHYTTRGVQNGNENNNVFVVRYNNFVIEEAGRVNK